MQERSCRLSFCRFEFMSAIKLSGQLAIVTGAARGIGQAIALELAAQGADIAICDLADCSSAGDTIEGVRDRGRQALYRTADVGNRTQMEAFFAECITRFGRIDILVNNAALNIRKPLLELEVQDVENVWSTSLWGVFHCSQLGARQMVRQGWGGNIVHISSVHAVRAFPLSTAYNAAKAAVNQMAKTWAAELGPHRIRVNVVEPGPVDTPGERIFMTEEQLNTQAKDLMFGRRAQPHEIASGVAYLVSDSAGYVTGSCLRIDGGMLLSR
jgi:glucose 1-dehydrogenase